MVYMYKYIYAFGHWECDFFGKLCEIVQQKYIFGRINKVYHIFVSYNQMASLMKMLSCARMDTFFPSQFNFENKQIYIYCIYLSDVVLRGKVLLLVPSAIEYLNILSSLPAIRLVVCILTHNYV